MPAGIYNLVIEQGATFAADFTWKHPDDNGALQPVDLTDFTVRLDVRDRPAGPLVCSLTSESGRILLGGEAGSIGLRLTESETAGLLAGRHVYQLELEKDGIVVRLLEGTCRITAEITHP